MSQRSKPGLTDRARRLAGKVRREPLARRLAASPLFDAGFYGAEVGRRFPSSLSGARHFVSSQAVARHSPHPLMSLPYVPKEVRAAWRTGGVPALLDWFGSAASSECPWGPYFDPREVPGVRAAITDPGGYLRELGADDRLPVHESLGDIAVTWAQARDRALAAARAVRSRTAPEPVPAGGAGPAPRPGGADQIEDSPQQEWVEAERGLIDWDAAEAGLERRVPGRVSIVVPVYEDCKMTVGAVRSIAEHTAGHDVEVVVVDNGSRQPLALALGTAVAAYPDTSVVHLDRNYNFAIGSNYGAAHSSGEFVLFLNNDTRVRAGWLDPLLEHLSDPAVLGVQPLLVFPDETIQCAGVEFLASDYLPCSLLAGHPTEDARAVRAHRFSAVTAAALLMRAADVIALRGFDPIFVNGSEDIDLCLRAAALRPGRFVVEPDSIVEHRESQTPGRGTHIPENRRVFMERWRGLLPAPNTEVFGRLGLEVAHLRSDGATHPGALPVVVRPRVRVDSGAEPRLRWSIKNPAPGSWWGQRWGDTRFIASLSSALRGCGQDAVSYRFGTYEAPATALDDVNLVLRGRRRIAPHPGQLNVLWIISHPEDVTREELLGFDLVYAASAGWAGRKSEEWDLDVRPLLQAADASIFQPRKEPSLPGADAGAVFVGQARTTGPAPRQIVMDAVAAGLQPKVWGGYWETHLPDGLVQATSVPYAELPRLYQSAGVVLCDHYPDMAREGFIANRIFDAVACGARVISDDVAGLDELFGGAVQVYESTGDLARLASEQGLASSFPPAPELAAIAERVVREHSYEVRARTLVRDVLGLAAARTQR